MRKLTLGVVPQGCILMSEVSFDVCLPLLVRDPKVKVEVERELGAGIESQLEGWADSIERGEPLHHSMYKAYDLIRDLVQNSSDCVHTLYGYGSEDQFPILILQFGPVFWVDAQEFDPVGYFLDFDEALTYAECEWAGYLESPEEMELPEIDSDFESADLEQTADDQPPKMSEDEVKRKIKELGLSHFIDTALELFEQYHPKPPPGSFVKGMGYLYKRKAFCDRVARHVVEHYALPFADDLHSWAKRG